MSVLSCQPVVVMVSALVVLGLVGLAMVILVISLLRHPL